MRNSTPASGATRNAYNDEWLRHDSGGKVNPAVFFNTLRAAVPDDAIAVVDDGNHTYLTAELFPGAADQVPDRAHRLQQHGLRGAGRHRRPAGQSGS
jgi:thiamine pyrophosphate-dependent acetolactate synthase large subunit-like protein